MKLEALAPPAPASLAIDHMETLAVGDHPVVTLKYCGKGHVYPAARPECRRCATLRQRRHRLKKTRLLAYTRQLRDLVCVPR